MDNMVILFIDFCVFYDYYYIVFVLLI